MMRQCLILVDIQNDYFSGGRMELAGMEAAAANAQRLLDHFRNRKMPVIHIQHVSVRPGSAFFLPGTEGAAIHTLVAPLSGETVLVKNFPNSFHETALLQTLQQWNVTSLVIAGAMSHMCIDATVRAAFDSGFQCCIAEDACAARDLVFKNRTVKAADVHASFMAALSAPYAKVASAAEIVESLK